MLRWAVAAGLLGLIGLGTLGQVVRDRSAAWGVLMYLPLPLIGASAVGWDLICRGRGLPRGRLRFALAAVGLATVLGSSSRLAGGWGKARSTPHPGASRAARVLHWNVIWGGGRRRSAESWASIRRTIGDQGADLVILSEAPPDDWLDGLVAGLGPTGSRVQAENEPGAGYWYKLAVCSKRPLRLLDRRTLRGGVALAVAAETDLGRLRVLVVDGQSNPFRSRTPFLEDVARLCRAAEAAGEPFDLVAGDFNSLSQSVGFDALRGAGYGLASAASPTWRGTFPAFAPVYDIDHVWVRSGRFAGAVDATFADLASDHRGQVVELRGW